jgi:hypothetical protein
LDDTGSCTVSQGVFDLMNIGWTGPPEYDIVGAVDKPPALQIGVDRVEQDYQHRQLRIGRR